MALGSQEPLGLWTQRRASVPIFTRTRLQPVTDRGESYSLTHLLGLVCGSHTPAFCQRAEAKPPL